MFPSVFVPLILSMFLVGHFTGYFRLLILVALYWMEAPWLPKVLNMFADIPQYCPVIKHLTVDVLIGQVLKGLSYNKGLPVMLETMGRLVCSRGCTKQCHSCP